MGSDRRLVTRAESRRWRARRARGETVAAIAKSAGRAPSVVYRHVRSVDAGRRRRLVTTALVCRWRELREQGYTFVEIAESTGHWPSTVQYHLRGMPRGVREVYGAVIDVASSGPTAWRRFVDLAPDHRRGEAGPVYAERVWQHLVSSGTARPAAPGDPGIVVRIVVIDENGLRVVDLERVATAWGRA